MEKHNLTLILSAFLLTACSEPTYDSSNTTTQVDSFISLINEIPQEQRKNFFQLYILYLQPYEEENGNLVTSDIKKLQGMTEDEVMKELWEHYDIIDYSAQHGAL